MKVFVTGASGFVGSAVVSELLAAGHQVLGLARSDASAEAIAEMGAQVLQGSLDDLDSLRRGASEADGVIHTAFVHDFSNYVAAAETDQRAIQVLGETLAGSNRPLIVTSGMAGMKTGEPMTEDDSAASNSPRQSEQAALPLAEDGVRVAVVRLPPSVHGAGDHGFVPMLINIARDKGVAAYPGDGLNRWPTVHRLDAAHLFRLVLEKGIAGTRYHAVAEEGIPVRDIAEAIGRNLSIPVVSVPVEKAGEHFGFLGNFFSIDIPASSQETREQLGWQPTQVDLITDIDQAYF